MMEEPVHFSIHDCSSYSADFTPDNVLVDSPSDAKSRWLSDGNKPPQYLTLRLSQPAILSGIRFGKWDKPHPCNLRKFQVYGGTDCDHMRLLLESGLKNDNEPESFSLKAPSSEKQHFPCLFVKIVPLVSWGYSSNFSVWFVSLTGVQDKALVHAALEHFHKYREKQAVRLCLKHLRQFDFPEAFEALHKRARVDLEHPLLSQLYTLLVERGDFDAVERAVQQAVEDGFMDAYLSRQPIEAQWTQIETKWTECPPGAAGRSAGGTPQRVGPGMRGGHQMCLDPGAELLYLYGGWDGSCDLGDLWRFDIRATQWACLCQDSSSVGGPTPRSCHKMCIDVANQKLYLLGRYMDTLTRTQLDLSMHAPGDFYCYCLRAAEWEMISRDTFADGGPHLIYDHQMCFDAHTGILYVFGGRILSAGLDPSQLSYSGLYAYHCTDKYWTCLRPDLGSGHYQYSLVPRMAHSMLYHPEQRKLYVLGGQRERQPLSDMLVYNLASDDTTVIADGKDSHIPASGFTVRTTLDPQRNEIYLLTGLYKSGGGGGEECLDESRGGSNSLWVCDCGSSTVAAKWTCVSQTPAGSWLKTDGSQLPPPRYAHQFVYDPLHQVHYMFGGNPGNDTSTKRQQNMRLDDFWRLKLVRVNKEQLLRHCQYIVKKLRFGELVAQDPVAALSFLQTDISAIVNHDDPQESSEFRQLASSLFTTLPPAPPSPFTAAEGLSTLCKTRRNEVYQELSSYFPEEMTQPRESILDMVKL